MTGPGPASWRVFLAIWRVGLLRWTRRLLGRFRPLKRRADMPGGRAPTPRKGGWSAWLVGLLRRTRRRLGRFWPLKRRAGTPGGRAPTPRKGGWSAWLAALLAPFFVFIVVANSSQLIGRLGRALSGRRPGGKMEISSSLHFWLAAKERMVLATRQAEEELSSAPASREAPTTAEVRASREWVLAELHEEVEKEFFVPRVDRHGGGQAAKQRFVALYLEHGLGAFQISTVYKAGAFPHTSSWPRGPQADAMLAGLAVILTAVFVLVLANALHASQDVAGGRWDMEWLFTMPLRARTIFLADLAKEVVSNPASWVIPVPFLWVVLFCAGYGWASSILLAVAGGAFVVVLGEAVRLPVEVYLRQRLRADRLRNVFAALGVVSMALLIGLITMAASGVGVESLAWLATVLPVDAIYLPWALPLGLSRGGATAAVTLVVMACIAGAAVWGAGALAERAARRGLVAQGAGLIGRGRRAGKRGGLPLGVVAGKELLLLARDRNYLVRTLILPVGLALFQMAINPTVFHGAKRNLHHASALAFALSAYMLLMSGTRLLIHEGQALWLLYTLPKRLDYVVRRKAVMWSVVAAALGAAVLAGAGAGVKAGARATAEAWVSVLGGIMLFGMISAAVGVLMCDPMETQQSKQVPMGAMFLLMMVAGLYTSCFYVPSTYAKVVTMGVFALAAVALWQKARARAPYLLDPVSRPPPSLDVGDAIIATFAFFAVQGILAVVLVVARTSLGQAVAIGYSLAAVVVGLMSMLILGARRIPGFLRQVGLAWPKAGGGAAIRSVATSIGLGLGAGVAAAAFAVVYLWVASRIPSLRPMLEAPSVWREVRDSDRVWLGLMFVVAAPIFEEYLFRGLLLRSLQRDTRMIRAVVFSSVIFALMHPPIAFLPVFVLGVAAAVSFGRNRSLLAPVLAHMVYNALLVAGPLLTASSQ